MHDNVDQHGQNRPSTEFDKRKKLVYDLAHSPSHFKRPAYYLKQLRECGDYRSCDIELVTRTGSENIHSAIAAAHCKRIAKLLELHDTPLRIDMRRFRLEAVLNVVGWIYNGKVEILWEHMADHMAVTNYLGVVFLHHQFENTLKVMAKDSTTRTEAVNVASHPTTGASPETVLHIVHVLHEGYATITLEEIRRLQPWSIRTLVATSVRTPMKISLINIALDWLRDPPNIVWIDTIVNNICIYDMNLRELIAFQKTLRAVLLNPSTRRLVAVLLEKDGTIAINMDKADCTRSEGVPMQRSKKEMVPSSLAIHKVNQFYPLLMHEQNRDHSVCNLSELPSYSNVASLFSSYDSNNSEESLNNASNQYKWSLPHITESFVEAIRQLPPAEEVFRNGPCSWEDPRRGATTFTAAVGNFNNDKVRISPVGSSTKFATNRERRLHYTQSEIEELQNYPSDTFIKIYASSDGSNIASGGVGESKPAQQAKAKENSDSREEFIPPSVACDSATSSENRPKYVMSHYAF